MKTVATHEVLTGICSCCLGRFVVDGKVPVLHGYKRPGDGFIRGNCDGMRFPAYEISTEGCIWMRDGLLEGAKSLRNVAQKLRAGEIKEIVREVRNYRLKTSSTLILTPDSSKEDLRTVHVWTWEELVEIEAQDLCRRASMNERHAETFQTYIAAWKPNMELLSESRLNAEKQEKRETAKQFKRYARWGKSFGAAFGAGPAEHKRVDHDLATFNTPEVRRNWSRDAEAVRRYETRLANLHTTLKEVGRFPTDKQRKVARENIKNIRRGK